MSNFNLPLNVYEFNKIANGEVFMRGVAENNSHGLYMTPHYYGRPLKWIAKKFYNNDWCIYCGWDDEKSFEDIERTGDKVTIKSNIQKLVPCDETVWDLYRL